MAHHGQHPICEQCDRQAGFDGNRWYAAKRGDVIHVTRVWWERGSCSQSFRVDPDGSVYDCLLSPRRIDSGKDGYVSREDRDWAEMVAGVAAKFRLSGLADAIYWDSITSPTPVRRGGE